MKEQVYCYLSAYEENIEVFSNQHRDLLRHNSTDLLVIRASSDEIDMLAGLLKDRYVGGMFYDASNRPRNTLSIGILPIIDLTGREKIVENADDFMSQIHDLGLRAPKTRETNESSTR